MPKKSKGSSEESKEQLTENGNEDPSTVEKRVIKNMEPEENQVPGAQSYEASPTEEISAASMDNEAQENEQTRPAGPSSAPDVPDFASPELAEEQEQPEFEPADAIREESDSEGAEVPDSDPEIAKAVDDIVAKEGDEVLAAEDEKIASAFTAQKPNLRQRLRNFLAAWWNNRLARWITLGGLAAAIVALAAIPYTRYFMLNTAGVRASASLSVLDSATQLPLKNVQIKLAGQTATSNEGGLVKLTHLKLGATELVVQKPAFAPIKNKVVIGWGSNPFGDIKLTSVGIQYFFKVSDFLSGKPIEKAEATSGDASALADNQGRIVLSIDKTADPNQPIAITADTYRTEQATGGASDKDPTVVKLVPARKDVFVSKRSGKYDVYKVDVDGKNEQVVLAGTGAERDDMVLVPSPTDDEAVLVSTRDNIRNSDGFLLSTLTLLNLKTNTTIKLAQSERIQIVGWNGNQLVYVEIAAGASAANPKRNRLLTYDYKSAVTTELATSNYFNDVLLANNEVYYAPSSAYQSNPAKLFKVSPDGTNRQAIVGQEVWNVFRTSYDHLALALAGGQDWNDYHFGDSAPTKLTPAPANPKTRVYIDSPDRKHSLWVDDRDGKGVLLAYDVTKKADVTLKSQSGLKYPLNWLNDKTVVYRINTDQETADYVLSLDGGEPKKIRDVNNTSGLTSWYYY